MYEVALSILNNLEENGFKAYIVGGYPRDKYMNRNSSDIDICTSAKVDDIEKIFSNIDKKYSKYGNVIIIENNYKFEVTTFRNDIYLKNRNDILINYVETLKEDLKRRDFIINTLCIDKDGNYVDLMNARNDIDNKTIRLVRNDEELKEDPLRILRAIRFATILNFKLDKELEKGIIKYGYLIDDLSINKKKIEIDKIINSYNKEYGLKLIKKYKLDKFINKNNV
ncbi:MAG: hypothetical protein J6K21_05135 [Bacilli bacterium]|nr:hypothetical protein [Bacilli bacterium]